jgi:hypothetical protein
MNIPKRHLTWVGTLEDAIEREKKLMAAAGAWNYVVLSIKYLD